MALASFELGHDPVLAPRHANEQFDTVGTHVDFEKRAAGDLVFFVRHRRYGDQRFSTIGHAGILVERDSFVHSQGLDESSVVVSELEQSVLDYPDERFEQRVYLKRPTLTWSGRWRV